MDQDQKIYLKIIFQNEFEIIEGLLNQLHDSMVALQLAHPEALKQFHLNFTSNGSRFRESDRAKERLAKERAIWGDRLSFDSNVVSRPVFSQLLETLNHQPHFDSFVFLKPGALIDKSFLQEIYIISHSDLRGRVVTNSAKYPFVVFFNRQIVSVLDQAETPATVGQFFTQLPPGALLEIPELVRNRSGFLGRWLENILSPHR